MNLLLDTHVLIWAAGAPRRLSKKAVKLLADKDNNLYFSAASFWEINIKLGLEREDFQVNPRLLLRGMLDNGWQELAVTTAHTCALEHLPPIHKDPFDRILLAQAEVEGFTLVTTDAKIAEYSGSIQLI